MKPGNLGSCFGPVSTASSWRKPDVQTHFFDQPEKKGRVRRHGDVFLGRKNMCSYQNKRVRKKIWGINFKLLFIVLFSLWFQLIPQKKPSINKKGGVQNGNHGEWIGQLFVDYDSCC